MRWNPQVLLLCVCVCSYLRSNCFASRVENYHKYRYPARIDEIIIVVVFHEKHAVAWLQINVRFTYELYKHKHSTNSYSLRAVPVNVCSLTEQCAVIWNTRIINRNELSLRINRDPKTARFARIHDLRLIQIEIQESLKNYLLISFMKITHQ